MGKQNQRVWVAMCKYLPKLIEGGEEHKVIEPTTHY